MTIQSIQGLRELEGKATPGEWEHVHGEIGHRDRDIVKQKGVFDWVLSMQISNSPGYQDDASLIVSLRNNAKALLDMAEWALENGYVKRSDDQNKCQGCGVELVNNEHVTTLSCECRKDTKDGEALASFTCYCNANPGQRFWQALRNWSNVFYQERRSHIFRANDPSDGGASDWRETAIDMWEL